MVPRRFAILATLSRVSRENEAGVRRSGRTDVTGNNKAGWGRGDTGIASTIEGPKGRLEPLNLFGSRDLIVHGTP